MKKTLVAITACGLFVPTLVFAAYNDVSLTTDTVLSVGGVTLNVTGSTAAVESITVNASDFSVTLQAGSSFKVTAPDLNRLSASTLSGVSQDICSATQSILGYAPNSSSVTVTITPSATLCSSGGGGGSAPAETSASPASSSSSTVAPATTVTTPAPATETTTVVTPTTVSSSGLSTSQIQSILDVLISFEVDAATLASVRAALEGTTTGSVTSVAVRVFKANLTVGSLGSEVRALQQFLNSHGYPVAASGPGSSGNETAWFGPATKAALAAYQKAKGITPAAGYFGPLTRAAVNAEQ